MSDGHQTLENQTWLSSWQSMSIMEAVYSTVPNGGNAAYKQWLMSSPPLGIVLPNVAPLK